MEDWMIDDTGAESWHSNLSSGLVRCKKAPLLHNELTHGNGIGGLYGLLFWGVLLWFFFLYDSQALFGDGHRDTLCGINSRFYFHLLHEPADRFSFFIFFCNIKANRNYYLRYSFYAYVLILLTTRPRFHWSAVRRRIIMGISYWYTNQALWYLHSCAESLSWILKEANSKLKCKHKGVSSWEY